jgi:lipoprotein signal peptidase
MTSLKNRAFSSKIALILAFIGAVIIDLVSKFLVVKFGGQIVLYNPGVAFSLLASNTLMPKILMIASLIVSLALMFVLLGKTAQIALTSRIGLLLIAAGAFGNGADRLINLLRGLPSGAAVTDFINYRGFFTGNIADIFVVVGAALLAVVMVVDILKTERKSDGTAS